MASDITGFPREKIDSVDEYLDSYAKFLRQGIDSVDRDALKTAMGVFRPDLYDAAMGQPSKAPDGTDAVTALRADGRTLEFIKDQYRHCKPILALGASGQLLASGPIADGFEVVMIDAMIEPDYIAKVLEACDGALCFAVVAAYGFLWPRLSGHEAMHGVSATGGH